MKKRLLACVLALALLLGLTTAASGAADDLFFVAVNDSIPLTIVGAKPHYAATGLYVPYTVFDAAPGGVAQAYNASEQTLVLFTRAKRLVFDIGKDQMTDENGNTSSVLTIYKSGLLYIPLSVCAGYFGLSYSMLTSQSGCPVLRFTTGSEIYDDDMFLQKAENLIAYRIQTHEQEQTPSTPQPNTRPQTPEEDEPQELVPVYLAVTNAAQMADALDALQAKNLHAAFFLTAAELEADPLLACRILAAGHTLGLSVEDGTPDVAAALHEANSALAAVLHTKTVLALLTAEQAQGVTGYRVFTRPTGEQSATELVEQPQAQRLFVCAGDLAGALDDLDYVGAAAQLLRETSPIE
mgnify:CR=1 FL=1